MRGDISFEIGKFKVEVSLNQEGDAIEVRCSDGGLVVVPRFANVIEVRPEPLWDHETNVKVVANLLRGPHTTETPISLAEKIVDSLRGHQ